MRMHVPRRAFFVPRDNFFYACVLLHILIQSIEMGCDESGEPLQKLDLQSLDREVTSVITLLIDSFGDEENRGLLHTSKMNSISNLKTASCLTRVRGQILAVCECFEYPNMSFAKDLSI